MRKILFALIFAAAITAQAAPQPIDTVPHFSYWESLWKASTEPTEATLTGTWHRVAGASQGACFVRGYSQDFYLQPGDETRYGQVLLTFDRFPSGPRGEGASVFGVRYVIRPADGKNVFEQGPFRVRATEPQFAVFGDEDRDYYYDASCRLSKANANELVCLLALHLGRVPRGYDGWDDQAYACQRLGNRGEALMFRRDGI